MTFYVENLSIYRGSSSHHQQLIPASFLPQILKSILSSPTGGHLGLFKTVEKVPEHFYWPGFQEDIKLFINRCEQCQKRANPPKAHRHCLVKRTPSYPFHHIGIVLDVPIAYRVIKIVTLNQRFSKLQIRLCKWIRQKQQLSDPRPTQLWNG